MNSLTQGQPIPFVFRRSRITTVATQSPLHPYYSNSLTQGQPIPFVFRRSRIATVATTPVLLKVQNKHDPNDKISMYHGRTGSSLTKMPTMKEKHFQNNFHHEPRYKMEILYTDEEANMTGLPEWHPPEPVDHTAYIALLTSLGLLLVSLVIPVAIVLLFQGYKRSLRTKEEQKPVLEDLSQLDHIFDPDGEYRESKFDGMLNEDAADDVEFSSQSIHTEIAFEMKKSKEDMTSKKHAATQTDPLYVYGTDKIFDRYDVQRTMEFEDERLSPSRPSYPKITLKRTQRDTARRRGRTERKHKAVGSKEDAKKQKGSANTEVTAMLAEKAKKASEQKSREAIPAEDRTISQEEDK